MKIELIDIGAVITLIVVMVLVLVGCDPHEGAKQWKAGQAEKIEQTQPSSPRLKIVRLPYDGFGSFDYVEFKIDGCEYIHFLTSRGETIHKPNCPNHGGNNGR